MPTYNKLLVASAKGGVGKSTTALGLAVAFAESGKKVLLVDLDSASRSLDMLLGAEDHALMDFGDIIDGGKIADASITPIPEMENLRLISACGIDRLAALAKDKEKNTAELIRDGVERIIEEKDFDILVCDTGGGIDFACAVVNLFDMTIITSEQGKTSIRGAEYAASQLEANGAETMRLVICAFDLEAVKREKRAGMIEMIDSSALSCVGVVPFDPKLQGMQDRGMLPDKKSTTAIAYSNISKRITGYDVTLFGGMKKLHKQRTKAL